MTSDADGPTERRFPVVTVSLIAANFAVWLFYQVPQFNASIREGAFYPCTVNDACDRAQPWVTSWISAMFMHASWGHLLGNMLYLLVFGKGVEAAFGRLNYLAFYFAGGFVATMTQTAATLLVGTAADARIPTLGASGAISAVLGAYWILYPRSKIVIFTRFFPLKVPTWLFLGVWFVYQLVEAYSSVLVDSANKGGVAFFAHIGGFLFGVIATLASDKGRRFRADYQASTDGR